MEHFENSLAVLLTRESSQDSLEYANFRPNRPAAATAMRSLGNKITTAFTSVGGHP